MWTKVVKMQIREGGKGTCQSAEIKGIFVQTQGLDEKAARKNTINPKFFFSDFPSIDGRFALVSCQDFGTID
jgi:hypothetical protein